MCRTHWKISKSYGSPSLAGEVGQAHGRLVHTTALRIKPLQQFIHGPLVDQTVTMATSKLHDLYESLNTEQNAVSRHFSDASHVTLIERVQRVFHMHPTAVALKTALASFVFSMALYDALRPHNEMFNELYRENIHLVFSLQKTLLKDVLPDLAEELSLEAEEVQKLDEWLRDVGEYYSLHQ